MERTFEPSISDESLKEVIRDKRNFAVSYSLSTFIDGSTRIERLIEDCGLTCQVYTKGRMASLILARLNPLAALAALVAIVVHNVKTAEFDYEVARNPITGTVTATFVK